MKKNSFIILALLCSTLSIQSMNLLSSLTARCKKSRTEKNHQESKDAMLRSINNTLESGEKIETLREAVGYFPLQESIQFLKKPALRPQRCDLRTTLLSALGITAFLSGAYTAHTAVLAADEQFQQQ